MLVRGAKLTVGTFDDEADYSEQVLVAFDRFRQGDVKDYRLPPCSGPPGPDPPNRRSLNPGQRVEAPADRQPLHRRWPRRRVHLLAFALDLAGERTADRLAAIDRSGAVLHVVRRWLLATLPLDAERRAEGRIWLEFAARAASNRGFARTLTKTDFEVRDWLSGYLQHAQSLDKLARGVDTPTVAHALLALADGLAVQLLYAQAAGDEAPHVSAAVAALEVATAGVLQAAEPDRSTDAD